MSLSMAKTAGSLFASLSGVTDENMKIELFGSFLSIVNGQIQVLAQKTGANDELKKDSETLKKVAEVDFKDISSRRDNTVSPARYAVTMTRIQERIQIVIPICIRWNLIEFSDMTRFGDYEIPMRD